MKPTEITKTSLLVIATIFTAVGAATLPANILHGSILLLAAVLVLTLRGYLKQKGIDTRTDQ